MDRTGERRRLVSRDLLRLEMADDPQLSPDGSTVAWVRTWIDAAQNRYRSRICLTSLESGETRPLTPGRALETQPRWSPDGRTIAFLAPPPAGEGRPLPPAGAISVVGRGAQLFVIPAGGGDPRQLTHLAGGIQEPAWSPDGRRIAFVTYVEPSKGLEPLDPQLPDDPYTRFNRDVLVTGRMDWKQDGIGQVGDYRRLVAWLPFSLDEDAPAPAPFLLTQAALDLGGIAWSPDSGRIAAIGSLSEPRPSRRRALYLLDVGRETTLEPEPLFTLEDIRQASVAWSPDGRQLALSGHDDPAVGHYGNQKLWVVEAATGHGRCLTDGLDRTWGNAVWTDVGRYGGADGPRWSADGRHLFALLSNNGGVQLCRVRVEDGAVTGLTPEDQVVAAFTLDEQAEQAVLLVWPPHTPATLHVRSLSSKEADAGRLLVEPNGTLLDNYDLSPPQSFSFLSDGEEIEGWIIPPVGAAPGARYPTILYHGGGPGGMRAANFLFEFQLYAAQGYGVVYLNTRGCQGYGQAFCTAILGDWGGADYRDNLRGLEVACERFTFIDPDRLLTAGGSYGGYQVNWILPRDHRFRAAVSDRSVFNRLSSYGTSDMGFLREFEFGGGPPWATAAVYLRQSPLTFMQGTKTPTLVVHSAQDLRCPIEQGEQLYMTLKRLGVPTEFVRFPDESHGLSRTGRPWHRLFRLDRYLEWFERWLHHDTPGHPHPSS